MELSTAAVQWNGLDYLVHRFEILMSKCSNPIILVARKLIALAAVQLRVTKAMKVPPMIRNKDEIGVNFVMSNQLVGKEGFKEVRLSFLL